MIIINEEDLTSHGGVCCCEYGISGVGKTVTTLISAPDPILWLTTEQRKFALSVAAAKKKRPKLKYSLAINTDFMSLIDFLDNPDKKLEEVGSKYLYDDFKTIFFDGLSYFQNVVMPGEIQKADTDTMDKRTLRSMTRVNLGQTGDSNQAIFRVMRLLKGYVGDGKVVIVSCLEMERPKYDQEFEAGPALGGKQVPDNFPGFFDYIGRVMIRYDKNDKKVYPPLISFDEGQGFLAKYTGIEDKREGPMNWSKILGSTEGKEKKVEKEG